MHLTQPAPPIATVRAGLPPKLAAAIDRCLAKDPAERFPTGEALAEAIADVRAGSVEVAPPVRAFLRDRTGVGYQLGAYGLALFYLNRLAEVPFEKVAPVLSGLALLSVGSLVSSARKLLRAGFAFEEVRAAILADYAARLEEAGVVGEDRGPAKFWAAVAPEFKAKVLFWLGILVYAALWLTVSSPLDSSARLLGLVPIFIAMAVYIIRLSPLGKMARVFLSLGLLLSVVAFTVTPLLGLYFFDLDLDLIGFIGIASTFIIVITVVFIEVTIYDRRRSKDPSYMAADLLMVRFWMAERWFFANTARWVFAIAGIGMRRAASRRSADTGTRTEVLIAHAAEDLLRGLPSAVQARLGNGREVLERLQAHIGRLRDREAQLAMAVARAGPAVPAGGSWAGDGGVAQELKARRQSLREELEQVRRDVAARRASAVAAMENIRLQLLRLEAGVGSPDDLTADLEAAATLEREIAALVAAYNELDTIRR